MASWPKAKQLAMISRLLEEELDEGIAWSKEEEQDRNGVLSRTYNLCRDENVALRHRCHFLAPLQLQLMLTPAFGLITIGFFCLPECDRNKGLGVKTISKLEDFSKSLGYTALTLNAMLGCEEFWQKCGFAAVSSGGWVRYPRPMIKLLRSNVRPEIGLCRIG